MQYALGERQHRKSSTGRHEVVSPAPKEHSSSSRVPGQSILADTEEGTLQPFPFSPCYSAVGIWIRTKQTQAKKYRVSFPTC